MGDTESLNRMLIVSPFPLPFFLEGVKKKFVWGVPIIIIIIFLEGVQNFILVGGSKKINCGLTSFFDFLRLTLYPFRQSIFPSDLLELLCQSPLLGNLGKHTTSR